jgi:hypothetical protein
MEKKGGCAGDIAMICVLKVYTPQSGLIESSC